MLALECHLGGVEVLRRMFRHDDKIEPIGLRRRNDLLKASSAVTAEEGMHMGHAPELCQAIVGLSNALRIQLLNCRMKTPQFVTTMGEGNLREQNEDEQEQ